MSCDTWKPLLAGYIDAELTGEEEQRLKGHLSHCADCRREHMELKELAGVTMEMKSQGLPDAFWDRYWLSIYNRLERGVAWVFLSAGAALLVGYGLWVFTSELLVDASTPLIVRVGVAMLAVGLAVLVVSSIRERWRRWKVDPYKEVQR